MMLEAIRNRCLHAYRVVIRPVWTYIFVIGVGVLLGVYQGVISLFVDPAKRGPYDVWNNLPHWPWGWLVVIGAAVVALILLDGSYRITTALETRVASLEKQLNPDSDMTITLHNGLVQTAGGVDADGRELMPAGVFLIHIYNNSNKFLRACQLKFGENPRLSYPASKLFDLKPGEHQDISVLRVEDDRDGRGARALLHFLRPPEWQIDRRGVGWLPGPGIYNIQAYSENSQPVSLVAELSADQNEGVFSNWRLTPCG